MGLFLRFLEEREKMHLHLKKGALHKALGVSSDKHIPAKKLSKALHSSSPLMRKRANFARNAAKWHKG